MRKVPVGIEGSDRSIPQTPAWTRRLFERFELALPGRLDEHAYREHLARQSRLHIAWLALEAAIFYPTFAILDALVFPRWFKTFLLMRVAITGVIVMYAAAAWRWPRHRLATGLIPFSASLGQAGVLVMIFLTGGFDSIYWVGLLVMYAAYVGVTPHGGRVAAYFFGSSQAVYFFGCWIFCGPPRATRAVEAMFFLGCSGALLTCSAAFNALNRRLAFVSQLRLAEQKLEIQRIQAQRAEAVERSRAGRLCGYNLANRFLLSEVLGRGGAGEVYLAQDVKDGQPRAIKVLNSELAEDQESIRRFLREAEHATLVGNEHVVQFFETGHDPVAGHYLVMEYVAGEDLGSFYNRRGMLSTSELWPIISQIAKVLDVAHATGVIHRDLKPKNVLLTTVEGQTFVKLIDFGISKLLAPRRDTTLTAPVAIVGSIGYMAPEQALGLSAAVGPATDVFALAAIVYRGLTGRVAFPGEDLMNFCLKVCFQPFAKVETINPAIDPDVNLALMLAMAKDPIDRLSSPSQFVQLLELAGRGCLGDKWRKRARSLLQPSGADAVDHSTLSVRLDDLTRARETLA